jgi:hypothetical protein
LGDCRSDTFSVLASRSRSRCRMRSRSSATARMRLFKPSAANSGEIRLKTVAPAAIAAKIIVIRRASCIFSITNSSIGSSQIRSRS